MQRFLIDITHSIKIIPDPKGAWCKYSDVAALESQLQQAQAEIADLNEALEDKRRLAREIDEIINGKEGMALQASLCDIQKDVKRIEAENAALRAVKGLAVKLLDSVDVENEITWALLDALTAAKGVD